MFLRRTCNSYLSLPSRLPSQCTALLPRLPGSKSSSSSQFFLSFHLLRTHPHYVTGCRRGLRHVIGGWRDAHALQGSRAGGVHCARRLVWHTCCSVLGYGWEWVLRYVPKKPICLSTCTFPCTGYNLYKTLPIFMHSRQVFHVTRSRPPCRGSPYRTDSHKNSSASHPPTSADSFF